MVSSPMIHFVHGSSSPPSVRNQFSSLRLELSSIENFDHVSLLKFPIKFEVGKNWGIINKFSESSFQENEKLFL